MEKFFSYLQGFITSLNGSILIVGDLNIDIHRNFRHGLKESIFIDSIIDCGLKSLITGISRPKSQRQLDYSFSNFDCVASFDKGLKSDHLAIVNVSRFL